MYEFGAYYIFLFPSLFYYDYTKTQLPPDRFVASSTPGGMISRSISTWYLNRKKKNILMNGGGKGFQWMVSTRFARKQPQLISRLAMSQLVL